MKRLSLLTAIIATTIICFVSAINKIGVAQQRQVGTPVCEIDRSGVRALFSIALALSL